MSHNFEKLKRHILPLSKSRNFDIAKKEWILIGVQIHSCSIVCPCGKPIKEMCYIKNKVTGKKTYVGNVCINQFLEIKTDNLFQGLKRILKDGTANPNEAVIEYAYKFGYIYENEYKFLLSTKNKRKLTDKQQSWKNKINWRILNQVIIKETEMA